MRRSAFKSRPPGFELAWRGGDYEVWQRTRGAPAREHLALGEAEQPGQPCRAVRCGRSSSRRRAAVRDGCASRRALERRASRERTERTTRGAPIRRRSAFGGPGSVTARVVVPRAGTTVCGSRANVGRALSATVDGRSAGSVERAAAATATCCSSTLRARRRAADVLRLERAAAARSRRATRRRRTSSRSRSLPLEGRGASGRSRPDRRWRALCGQLLDWVETV